MRNCQWLVLLYLVSTVSCVAPDVQDSPGTSNDYTQEDRGSRAAVDIPDDGNHYIVPNDGPVVLYLRPDEDSPEVYSLEYDKELSHPVQVYSVREEGSSRVWWEARYWAYRGYMRTDSGFGGPDVPTELPPQMDLRGGRDGDNLLVTGISSSPPNPASGVNANLGVVRPESGPVIKYLRVDVSPFNEVGDRVVGETSGRDQVTLKKTGPIRADGSEDWFTWENIFYNSTITCLKINSVEIEYMDGSTERAAGDQLSEFLHPRVENDCSYAG